MGNPPGLRAETEGSSAENKRYGNETSELCPPNPSPQPPVCGWIEDNMVPLKQITNFEVFGYLTWPSWARSNGDTFYHISDVCPFRVNYGDLLNTRTPVPQSLRDVMIPAKRARVRVHFPLFEPPSNQRRGLSPWRRSPTIPWVRDMIRAIKIGGLDGISLDWEWQYNRTQALEYAGVLRNMREAFSAAFPRAYKYVGYSPQPVIRYSFQPGGSYSRWVDRAQVQTYDGAVRGSHGSLLQATSGIQRVRGEGGFSPGKLHMGIPFYVGNPGQLGYGAVANQVWPDKDRAKIGGRWYPIGSPATVRKRVRWAMNNRLAGVMIWNLNSDLPYRDYRSMLRAITSEIARRYQRPYRPFDGANVVGVNFVGGHGAGSHVREMGNHDVAGLAPQRYWNNLRDAAGTSHTMRDGHGHSIETVVDYRSIGTNDIGLEDIPGERRMMSGYLDTDRTSVTRIKVTDIPYRDYYVLLYHDGDNNNRYSRARYALTTYDSSAPTRTHERFDEINDNMDSPDFDGRFRSQRVEAENSAPGTASYSVWGMLEEQDSFTLTAQAIDGPSSARAPINGFQIVDATHRINLANIVAGGDGFGAETDIGLSTEEAGSAVRSAPEPYVHTSRSPGFRNVPYAFVDRVFMPIGDLSSSSEQPIDGANNRFHFGPDAGASGSYGTIYSGFGAAGNPTNVEIGALRAFESSRFISFGAQNGITFDLNAIRTHHKDLDLTAFTAIVGDNRNIAGGSIDYFVLVDGELVQWDIDLTDTEHFLYVKLPANASFLSLAVTDSADGIDSDRGYFANPFLLFKKTPIRE